MSTMAVPAGATRQSISLVVTRANGTVENLGIANYWHKSRVKRGLWWLFKPRNGNYRRFAAVRRHCFEA